MDVGCVVKDAKHFGKQVMLKKLVRGEEERRELVTHQLFLSPELAEAPQNHCARLLDCHIALPGVESWFSQFCALSIAPYSKHLVNSSNSSLRHARWSIYFPIVFLHTLIQGWSYRASSTSIRVSWSIGTNLFCVTALFYRVASRTTTLCLTLPEGFHPVKLDRSRDFKHKATPTYTRN